MAIKRGVGLILLILFFTGTHAFALSLGTNITIWDKVGAANEDGEVEPGCVWDQKWDLEGFFLTGSTLTMVGGYNFKDGYGGFAPGDIFIDINGDAKYGPANTGSGGGNTVVKNTFGYDYVLDIDYSKSAYTVYSLNGSSTVTVYYGQNDESNPWLYSSGGIEVAKGVITFWSGLSDIQAAGLAGGNHYAAAVDLGFLAPGTQFIAHYTMQCGNDNLMGSGTAPVPEPATMILLGSGLIGLAGLGRRKSRQ